MHEDLKTIAYKEMLKAISKLDVEQAEIARSNRFFDKAAKHSRLTKLYA